ncbi:MAG: hypothetical protein A2583_14550 [Bdellovibrionales bacterium RIFOXYD1_FULL_53_11]|nr:MAG: hypothetical protein A2583_14550 [Bdellovibrionales bacterium RIFOXYD1_FULL_53_11]
MMKFFYKIVLLSQAMLAGGIYAASPALVPRHVKNHVPAVLSRNPLVVVHASRDFDESAIAKDGIDSTIREFRAAGRQIVFLVNDQTERGYKMWYTADRAPDYELFSEGGEHNLPVMTGEITIVGGFFGSYDGYRGCHALATRDAVMMHFRHSSDPLLVHLPLKAIYFYQADSITRNKMLSLERVGAAFAETKKLFEEFAGMFFIVDNFYPAPQFGHPYNSDAHSGYVGGHVTLEDYRFEMLLNGTPVAKPFGTGKRLVLLNFEN